MRVSRRAVPAIALLALFSSGCMSWQPSGLAPRELVAAGEEPIVRVTDVDGGVYRIRDPRAVNDSIGAKSSECVPLGEGRYRRYHCPVRGIVAFERIARVDVQRRDGSRTAWALAAAIPVIALFVFASEFESGWSN